MTLKYHILILALIQHVRAATGTTTDTVVSMDFPAFSLERLVLLGSILEYFLSVPFFLALDFLQSEELLSA